MPTAANIVRALKGKWYGTYGMCRCPGHEDGTPSLSVSGRDGQILVHCHAGCSQERVIAGLFELGLWTMPAKRWQRPGAVVTRSTGNTPTTVDGKRIARLIWQECRDASGTIVERYLHSRGVDLPPAGAESIRFHQALKHPEGRAWPGMVAAITDASTAELIGIHRTFLDPATAGKAPVTPQKMILGRKRGGVIRLVADDELGSRIGYAEGIETALTAIAAGWACWAAIDAGNMATLPVWPWMDLALFADYDDAGIKAAAALTTRWASAGGHAVVIRAPYAGADWNDRARQCGERA